MRGVYERRAGEDGMRGVYKRGEYGRSVERRG
jgi:hypothetical protein